MRRLFVSLALLFCIAASAQADPVLGGPSVAQTLTAEGLFQKAACDYPNDFYCPLGQHRVCGPRGCYCAPCGGRYYGPPPGSYYGGPGDPGNGAYYGITGCPPHYTVQDGVCKPYRGP